MFILNFQSYMCCELLHLLHVLHLLHFFPFI